MNEQKLKELWWKARIGYNEQNCDPEVLEKFAELIVKECIGVVKADGDHWEKLSQGKLDRGQEHFRDHMLFAAYRLKEDAVESIKQHFGVEE